MRPMSTPAPESTAYITSMCALGVTLGIFKLSNVTQAPNTVTVTKMAS